MIDRSFLLLGRFTINHKIISVEINRLACAKPIMPFNYFDITFCQYIYTLIKQVYIYIKLFHVFAMV